MVLLRCPTSFGSYLGSFCSFGACIVQRSALTNFSGSVTGALSGKKGIAYNDASDALPFASAAGFGWAFNWVSNSAGLTNTVSYIPTLHNGESEFLDSWSSDAQSAIDAGAKYLFGFNEPGEYY